MWKIDNNDKGETLEERVEYLERMLDLALEGIIIIGSELFLKDNKPPKENDTNILNKLFGKN